MEQNKATRHNLLNKQTPLVSIDELVLQLSKVTPCCRGVLPHLCHVPVLYDLVFIKSITYLYINHVDWQLYM